MKKEIFDRQYDFEFSRKDNIYSVVNIPVIGVLAVSGALSVMLTNFEFKDGSLWLTSLFSFFCLVSVCFLIGSIGKISEVLSKNIVYKKIPDASELLAHYEVLVAHYQAYKNSNPDYPSINIQELSDRAFDDYVLSVTSRCIDENAKNNEKRYEDLSDSIKKLIMAIVTFGFASCFFVGQKIISDDKIYKVSVINSGQIKKNLSKNENYSEESKGVQNMSNDQNRPRSSAPPPPPPPPAGPDPRSFKGSNEVPRQQINPSGIPPVKKP